MIVAVFLLVLGFILLVGGAEKLVEAASGLASNYGIPNIVIGLTVVAFGTSAPELAVNLMASAKGSSEMVLANVLGSNIFNVLGILGITAVIYPLTVKSNTTWIEIPMSLLAAVSILVLAADAYFSAADLNFVSRGDGIILLLFFSVFLVYNIMVSKNPDTGTEEIEIKRYKTGWAFFWMILGLVGLVFGGKLIVDNAVYIAQQFGWSERLIGLTIVSIGTSLPELATSLAAVRKKKVDIAIGNVVGSNIFNIFFILGLSAIVLPVGVESGNFMDIMLNCVAGLLLFLFVFTGKGRRLERWEGLVFIGIYVAYLALLVLFP
ncbi:MAG: calcium/sodium antiporter [Cyclobacteriaceae bacterium]